MTRLAETIAARDAAGTRQHLLEDLRTELGADAAMFTRFVRVQGSRNLVPMDVQALGDADLVEVFLAAEGQPVDTSELDLATFPPVNAFDLGTPESVPKEVRDTIWTPLGLTSCLWMMVARGKRFLGEVALFRRHASAVFDADDLEAANRLARQVRLVIEAAEALEDPVEVASGAYVFGSDGRLRYQSHGAGTPEGAHAEKRLAPYVLDFLERDGPSEALAGRERLSLERLVSSQGVPAVLVVASPVEEQTVRDPMLLSPLKRRIVSYAIQGATVPEIARAIDRSPETVRAHIKQVYARLGIGSRVELSEACRRMFD